MGTQRQNDREVVVVTGSSGLLGTRVVDRLHERFQVVGMDVQGDPVTPTDVEFVPVDLTDDDSVDAAIGRVRQAYGRRIASVVHLAAYVAFSDEPSPLYDTVTVGGTRRLLRKLRDSDVEVEQFLFSSTMLVHEPVSPGQRFDEDRPRHGGWPYPESKIRTEDVIRDERGGIPVVLLRIAGAYDDVGHSPPICNQIKRVHDRRLTGHVYPGNQDAGQSFVHMDDLVEAIERVIDRRRHLPDVLPLLIGEEEVLGYGELQDLIGNALHGQDWRTLRVPKPLAKVGAKAREVNPVGEDPFIGAWMIDQADDHYALDITRAKQLLDWQPRHSLRETIPEMVSHLQEDPAGWYAENGVEPPRSVS